MTEKPYLRKERPTQLWSPVPSCSNIVLQGTSENNNELACPLSFKGKKNESMQKKLHTVQKTVVGVSLNATLASPKSQTLSLQFAFASIFFGLRSRWYTFAATKKLAISVNLQLLQAPYPNQFPLS